MYTTPLSFGQTIGRSLFSRRNANSVAAAEQGQAFTPIPDVYQLREAYYDGSAYELMRPLSTDTGSMSALPRTIRGVLQLVKPANDWWIDNVYRGAWTSNGRASSTSKSNMVPWEDDSPNELVEAAQQLLTWANWPERVRDYTRYTAVCADSFLENEIDYERQKVYPVVYHPSMVTHLVLNGSGDVVAYRLTVNRWDVERKQTFKWSKLVTKSTITTYYNDNEQGFAFVELKDGSTGLVAANDQDKEIDNPFGFAPGAWVNHRRSGGIHGECVINGLFDVLNEVNGLQSSINDYVMRIAEQQIILSSDDPKELATMLGLANAQTATATSTMTNAAALRSRVKIIPAPPGVTAVRMLEDIGLDASNAHLDRIMANISTNLPEATIEERLSQAGDVTGPGARAIVAPVQRKLDASCPGYDRGLLAVTLMGISMTGELIRTGIFNERTDALAKFAPFNLDSWGKGELSALSIASRDLVPETRMEKTTTWAAIERLQTVTAMRGAGLDDGDLYGFDANGKPNEGPPDIGIVGEKEQAKQEREAAAIGLFNGQTGV